MITGAQHRINGDINAAVQAAATTYRQRTKREPTGAWMREPKVTEAGGLPVGEANVQPGHVLVGEDR